ncbi:MAG: hypothetical protein ACW98D_12200 [Promethearchaeota archaeon]|jgi:hypothetical protein
MGKTKTLSILIIGLLLFLPFIKVSTAQASYVGIQEGQQHVRKLSLYKGNWMEYFMDSLGDTLNNLFPLDSLSELTRVYTDWAVYYSPPPTYEVRTTWPFTVNTIAPEQTGMILYPFDNTSMTSTAVYAEAGYQLNEVSFLYDGTWYIVNETSSFLRQTLNLTLAFSPYGIMGVPFAPKTINWTIFIAEFLGVMSSKGGLYKNISATAQSNGYSLHVPIQGFETNSETIDIHVTYDSNGVFNSYEFLYGGKKLTQYRIPIPANPTQLIEDDWELIIYSLFFVGGIGIFIVFIKRQKKK